jgi:hypothetical protein
MTTLIIIILQEINFVRIKLKQRETQGSVKSYSMKPFSINGEQATTSNSDNDNYTSFNFVDQAFDQPYDQPKAEHDRAKILAINGDEDICFDVRQYNNKNENNATNMLNVPIEELHETDKIIIQANKKSSIQDFINQHQTLFVIIFVVLLLLQIITSTIILFRSVTFSHFLIITPFVHPLVLVFYFIFKNYSCNIKCPLIY